MSERIAGQGLALVDEIFAEGGAAGAHLRSIDWAATHLGPVEGWTPSLRAALSICMGSSFPIALYWGTHLVILYNDGYTPIAGTKHPGSLGRPGYEVWAEIWDSLKGPFEKVTKEGKPSYFEDSLLFMHRHGYTEECYFNYSLSPVRGEGGRVEGVFNASVETTYRVINERRNRVLRELGERTALARTVQEASALAISTLGTATSDAPFCALYTVEGPHARLSHAAGVEPGGPAAPEVISLTEEAAEPWPLARALRSGRVEDVTGLDTRLGLVLPGGPWPEKAHSAMIAPILLAETGRTSGFLVLGASPRRAIDGEYRQFAERIASNHSRVMASAAAFELERQRAEQLAALDRTKTAFFSNVSHEFRTPLTLMIGPTEDALGSPGRALHGADLELVHRNELRLLKLVNTLLDFSRMEAGRLQVSFEPTDLAQLTRELASAFRSAVERAGLRLTVDCPPLPEPVWVDHDLWEKVVLNLLSNALKFTFAGEIAVRLRWQDSRVELSVSDTGTGIPPEELPRVFERFHRVHGARSRTHEGSGIGLSLVQELMKLHGGSTRVESTVGKGTTFTLTLPTGTTHLPAERLGTARTASSTATGTRAFVEEALRWVHPAASSPGDPPAAALPASSTATPPSIAHPGARILLVDDNADMREYISRLLGGSWTVEAVEDGQAALEAVQRQLPDLVLSDVMMPRLDGFGLLRALKQDTRTRMVPVILLSARAGEEANVEGMEAGADDYLVKPFSARELLARVNGRLEISRLRALNEEQARQLNVELERLVHERTARLEETNRELESFSYSVSHDLRAPLRHILGFSEMLAKHNQGRLDDKSQRHLRVISEAATKGGQLVDDLLAFSRLGRAEILKSRVDLGRLVEEVRGELAPELEGRRVHWTVAPLPVVQGDPALLRMVLKNLLSNAAKYTRPRAEARIEVSSDEGPDEVAIHVRDNGVGFEMQYVDKLFGVFQRLHTAEQFEGTGIGLAHVRRIVMRHGGRVWAESVLNEGASFHFTLPREARPPEEKSS